MERQKIFLQLKPACVDVLQATASLPQRPSARTDLLKSLTTLSTTLRTLAAKPGVLDAKLAEYVFVPISQILRISRTVPVRALELCLDCISVLLKASWGGTLAPELSGQLLILFTFMAKPSSAENGIAGTSEELQILALKCIGELFTEVSRTTRGKQQLTATANIPALGEAVLVVLDSLTNGNSNHVKLQAVCTIKSLVSAIDDKDALTSFLPRIVSSLTKALTPSSSNRASFRVLAKGLESLSTLFNRLFSDRETKDLPKAGPQSSQENSKVARSTSWLQATASQIKIAMGNVLKLRNHDKLEVRKALLGLCLVVVQECRTSLGECVGMVIETMVTLVGRGESHDIVEKDLKTLLSTDGTLSDLLRESLHGWIISLPRVMQSKDDAGRRQIIHQVSVTLRLLGDNVMLDDLLAGSLRDGVSAVFNDSKGSGSIVETASNTTFNSELALSNAAPTSFAPLKLRLKGQEDMMKEFKLLLGELAKSNTAVAVADDLVISLDMGSEESRLASFWISVDLLRDIMMVNPSLNDFVDMGTSNPQEELLDNLYSHALTILSQRDTDNTLNWHFPALALEVLALQATKYRTEFRAELSETLYPVLHHLGSTDPGLRSHAITCLNIIATACEYQSASELVIANVDYIVNAVGLRLSYGDVSPQAPQVLLMMMRLCGPSLLPYLDDLVASIFGALERYHGYPKLVELLFAVLNGMAEEGVKAPQLAIMATAEETPKSQEQDNATRVENLFSMIRMLEANLLTQKEDIKELPAGSFPQQPWRDLTEEEFKAQTTLPDEEEPPPQESNSQEVKSQEDPPPPVPQTFTLLLKIADQTQHYLTSSSSSLRTALLSLLQTIIPALAKHDTSFLPLINTLWPVLLPRLEDPEAYIVANALDIVALMCTHAGEFMRTRVDAAWELLKVVYRRTTIKKKEGGNARQVTKRKTTRLIDLSNITKGNAATGSGIITTSPSSNDTFLSRPEMYVNAPSRMIWDALVRLLCAISQHVQVQDSLFDEVLDMLDPILDREEVRKALDSRNADAVWLRLYKKSRQATSEKSVPWEMPRELGGPVKMLEGGKELGFVTV